MNETPVPAARASEKERDELIALIRERSFSQGDAMKLASGRTSSFYFNMKPTMMHAQGARLIARATLARIDDLSPDLAGGLEMGAVPLAAALAAVSAVEGRPIGTFFVRKQAKEHGTQSLIEGLGPGESMAGKRVVLLEDVTTTGGSALKAAEHLKAAGADIVAVVTVVDRMEGAREAFARAGLEFRPLLTRSDFA